MAKRMNDDEIMNYVYSKVFGDLDGIEAENLFSDDDDATHGVADNAVPASDTSGGISITVKPIMKSAIEGGKETDTRRDGDEEDDDEDKLEGISHMSPLMAQLHGER